MKPNGLPSSSPGLRASRATLGITNTTNNPSGVVACVPGMRFQRVQPLQGCVFFFTKPGVGARSSRQPWANGCIPVGDGKTIIPFFHIGIIMHFLII